MGQALDINILLEKRCDYELKIAEAHKKIDALYFNLESAFKKMYGRYITLDALYDITNIDFWFGDIACNYNGNNFELSDKLFSLNNTLQDIEVFDLTASQLALIYNAISMVINDVYKSSFAVISFTNITVNQVISNIKGIAEYLLRCDNPEIAINEPLNNSILKLYVIIDFALGDDVECKNRDLRSLHSSTLAAQSRLYDEISMYEEKILSIDELIDVANHNMCEDVVDVDKTISNIPKENIRRNIRRASIKDGLINALGTVGGILYYVINLIVAILPFVMIGGGFWFSFLLISLNLFIPYTSIIFWIWGLICAIQGVQDIWAILYYVIFVVAWIPFYINLILSLISRFKKK